MASEPTEVEFLDELPAEQEDMSKHAAEPTPETQAAEAEAAAGAEPPAEEAPEHVDEFSEPQSAEPGANPLLEEPVPTEAAPVVPAPEVVAAVEPDVQAQPEAVQPADEIQVVPSDELNSQVSADSQDSQPDVQADPVTSGSSNPKLARLTKYGA
jgi:hypothetical protein